MSQYEIPYINLIIRTFAERFQMSRQAAYAYLQKHEGLTFLIEFYDAAHRLQDKYLDQQIYFGSSRALQLLKKTDVWKIS